MGPTQELRKSNNFAKNKFQNFKSVVFEPEGNYVQSVDYILSWGGF